jgi:very-short-patch-repair endonuclease
MTKNEDITNTLVLEARSKVSIKSLISTDLIEETDEPIDEELTKTEYNPFTDERGLHYRSHKYHLKNRQVSHFEVLVGEYLESLKITLVPQVKLNKWVFDFAVFGTDILIEADGHYWHNLEESHVRDRKKDKWCKDNGYILFRVDENEFKKDKEKACSKILIKIKEVT